MSNKVNVVEKNFFATQYNNKFKVCISNSGNRNKDKYVLQIDSSGYDKLVVCGKEDVYDYIQSFSNDCDINILIKKYKQTGDVRSLVVKNGFYGDVSNMPDSLQGYYNLLRKGEDVFNQLSAEDKQRYNNNYLNFILNFKEDVKKIEPQPQPEPQPQLEPQLQGGNSNE